MKKKYIVKKPLEFTEAIKKGRYYKDRLFVIYIKDNNLGHYRFGISVSKKIGNAVVRNKVKRQMRMIIDNYKKNYQNGKDYIIIVRNEYIGSSFAEINAKYMNIIDKINSDSKEKKDEDK